MVIVTSRRVYMLFPTLVRKNLAITGKYWFHQEKPICQSPRLTCHNYRWDFPCGKECPTTIRRGRGDEGTAVFFWNGLKERQCLEEGKKESRIKRGKRMSGGDADGEKGSHGNEPIRGGDLFGRDEFKWVLKDWRGCQNRRCSKFTAVHGMSDSDSE
jgi:hypothetical protein